MKKFFKFLSMTIISLFLVACGAGSTESSTSSSSSAASESTLTLVITNEEGSKSEEITFEEGDTIMDVLEDNHEIEEDSGMVTAIDGVSQDAASNTYWMYTINEEMAPKGAEETEAVAGDTVEFYLETFE